MRDETNEHQAFALPGARPQYGPDKLVAVEHIDLHLTPDIADGVARRHLHDDGARARRAGVALDARCRRSRSLRRRTGGGGGPSAQRSARLRDATASSRSNSSRRSQPASERPSPYDIAFRSRATGSFSSSRPPRIRKRSRTRGRRARTNTLAIGFLASIIRTKSSRRRRRSSFQRGCSRSATASWSSARTKTDRTIFRYRQDVPHSTYLMTMVAGPFVEVAQGSAGKKRGSGLLLRAAGARERRGALLRQDAARCSELFEERIGTPYPYARYSQIAVSDFIFGGMENTSATTQTDRTLHDETAHLDFSSDPLVSHELAHQWFGDLLTCRDWAHAWLNEGFATFMEAVWREADLGYDEYLYDIFECLCAYLKEDSDRYRRPIVCNTYIATRSRFSTATSIKKGRRCCTCCAASSARRAFGARSRTTCAITRSESSRRSTSCARSKSATGRNLRGFFSQWVFREGHPKARGTRGVGRRAQGRYGDDRSKADHRRGSSRLRVRRRDGFCAGRDALRQWNETAGTRRATIRAHVERAHETIAVPLDFEPQLVRFDPGAFLLADVTYALGTDLAAATLRGDPNVVARIRAARELAKDGGRVARDALETAFDREPFWGVLAEAARRSARRALRGRAAILIGALSHPHPKVARAAAEALGNFRDPDVATALIATGAGPRFLLRARLRHSPRSERRAIRARSTCSRRRLSNARGTERSKPARSPVWRSWPMRARCRSCSMRAVRERSEGLRRAAVTALGRIADARGERAHARRRRTRAATRRREYSCGARRRSLAAESLGDVRLLPALDRLAEQAFDGRLRRDAMEAAIRIRKGAKVPTQVNMLRDDIDELREEQRRLQEKIEALART